MGAEDWALLLAAAALLLGGVAWVRWRGRRFQQELSASVAAYQRGDLRRAEELLAEMAGRYRRPGLMRGLVRYAQGQVALRKGDLDRAIERFRPLAEGSSLLRVGRYGEWIPAQLSVCLALRGDLEAAERWLAEARRRPPPRSVQAIVAEALLLCRRGRHEEAARLLAEGGPGAEGASGDWLRLLLLLRAFAADRLAGPGGARQAGDLLAALGPARAGEFDYAGRAWPELASFLSRSGLGARARRTSRAAMR